MLLTLLAISLQATTAASTQDARCLAAFSAMAASKDQKAQDAGKLGAVYFVGKLRGQNPNVDLATVLKPVIAGLTPIFQAEVQRCSAELKDAGAAMIAAGNSLD